MKRKSLGYLLPVLALFIMTAGQVKAQFVITRGGESAARIVLTDTDPADRTAAEILQRFVKEISGADLEIVEGKKVRTGDVAIGNGRENRNFITAGITEDGFRMVNTDGVLRIVSGGDKGSIHGVVTLLERYFDLYYWGEYEYDIHPNPNMVVPVVDITENPAFRYRQSQFYGMETDPLYKIWNRFEEPVEEFAGGYWVHTFDHLLPSRLYGEEHPEYYSYFNGKRNPGKASQWCLTNPEVLDIVAERIDSIFKANPDRHMISVSQNDGNYTNCTCDNCRAIDEHEEALSGSLIHFMNKLAERFPDKQLSTLAYLYTMKPPAHVKPLPNVNIMLCSIDADRELPLTENASGRQFYEALKGWSAISDNIFVWDYGINFDGYLTPFPNFHVLRDNIALFRDHNVKMHFSQIAGSRGGDFAEMRTWLVSRYMWNPDVDADSVRNFFIDRYYGPAAEYIKDYVKIMEGALLGSGKRLWIYDSPVSHKEGMLSPALVNRYNELFDKAEAAAARSGETKYLDRVQRTRIPLQYSELELDRSYTDMDPVEAERKLLLLAERTTKLGIESTNERLNSPQEYVELFRQRYMPRGRRSIAEGSKVEFIVPPSGTYAKLGETALVDGLFGGNTYTESWVGWEGIDGSFIIDLGEIKEFSVIETDFLHQLGAWILLPLQVTYSVSADGTEYRGEAVFDLPEDSSSPVKYKAVRHEYDSPVSARYIKVEVVGTKVCPEWHYGIGNPCWFFIDEVSVF